MAFRRPVKLDGGNLRNMSDAEILLLQQEAIRQYGLNPSTTLTPSSEVAVPITGNPLEENNFSML